MLCTVPGVAHAEYWPGASPYLIDASGVPGGTVALVGPDPGSALLALPLVTGRWLEPDDTNAAVVNQVVLLRNPSLRVGGPVEVRIEGRTVAFPIVGVVKELAPMPVIYTTPSAVLAATGRPAGWHAQSASSRGSTTTQRSVLRPRASSGPSLESGIEVFGMQRMLDVKKSILDHLVIILAILTMAAVIVVFVGALALTSMLSLNVFQRTREIGVLGAIGATPAHDRSARVVRGRADWRAELGGGVGACRAGQLHPRSRVRQHLLQGPA